MELNFLNSSIVPTIVGVCLCVGYVIKTSIPNIPNRFIPLILAIVGLLFNIWINSNIDPNIILGGLFSGLASTGLYETFKNIIGGK